MSVTASSMPRGQVMLLGVLTAVGSLSIDVYVPGLPALARSLSTSESLAQLTLTAFLLGFATGQATGGSVSDALGRRRPVLVALAAYVLVSLACAFAPSIEVLLVLRLAQGLVAGAVVVTARSVVRDRHSGAAAARLYSVLFLVMGAAPILGPIAGGQLLHVTSWRGIFVALAAAGVVLLGVSARGMRETLPHHLRRTGGGRDALATMAILAHDRQFLGYFLASGLGNACVFVWISGSPFVLQGHYGFSPQTYSLVFALMTGGVIGASQLNRWLVTRHSALRLLQVALAVEVAGACGGLVAFAVPGSPPVAAILPLLAMMSSIGIILPNALALAVADHQREAGTATGLMGVPQYLLGAALAPLVGVAGQGDGVPMAVLFVSLSLAAGIALRMARGRTSAVPEAPALPIL